MHSSVSLVGSTCISSKITQELEKSSFLINCLYSKNSFLILRVFLHKDWCGIRDEELSKVSGIEGSIFCHATGFIAGNQTKKGALEMALKSIDANGKI